MRTLLEWIAAAFVVGVLVLAVASCSNEPSYSSCKEAQQAGVPLPLTPDSPGWNPKLDRDHDGKAC